MVKILKCKSCDTMVAVLETAETDSVCCGDDMSLLEAKTPALEGKEKHVPVVTQDGCTVTVNVGSVEHPMTEEHHIAFIILETCQGFKFAKLEHTGKPVAKFALNEDETVKAAYEYCNLHGLWKVEC